MSKPIAALFIVLVFISSAIAYAGGRAYINGKLVEEKPAPKKFNEGDFIINKKGLKHEVLLELGWGDGDYEVGLSKEEGNIGPVCMFIDHNKDIYIGDIINNRIMVFSSNGKLKRIVEDRFGGGNFTVDRKGKIYSLRTDLLIYSSEGTLLEKVRVPRMASRGLPLQIMIKGNEILLFDGVGYQPVEIKEDTDEWGYHLSDLGTYVEGYPFEQLAYPMKLRIADTTKQLADMGYEGYLGGRYKAYLGATLRRGREKVTPSLLDIEYEGKRKRAVQLYDDTTPTLTIVLYNDYLREFEEKRIFIDDKGNVYQLRSTRQGVQVVAWRANK